MPSTIAGFKLNSNSGVINNGFTFVIAPLTVSKSQNGSGGNVTGDAASTLSAISITLTKLFP